MFSLTGWSVRAQKGFGAIAAIVVLVILATLAAAIVTLSTTQSQNLSQDMLSARADQAARAGLEWGLFQAFNDGAVWKNDTSTDLRCSAATDDTKPYTATIAPAGDGFQATVTCWSKTYGEGETLNSSNAVVRRVVRLYQFTSVACPVGGDCPRTGGAIAVPVYVERRREATGIVEVPPP
jgi:MSHA biogenesis protein MshP